jgi:hypothetical protein
MLEEFLKELKSPEPLLLNITGLPRGVDNYHIDVKLSPKFRADFKKLLGGYVLLETSQKQQRLKNDKDKQEFQDSYVDMMTVLINRVKSDLSPEEVSFLQFAVYRFILDGTKSALDDFIKEMRARLTELRSKSSGKALSAQEQVFWLSKHYHTILYAINRHFFVMLKQFESRDLQALRRQYLNPGDEIYIDIFFNPMLLTASLDADNFLIEKYLLWNKSSDTSEFPDLNNHMETLCREMLPELEVSALVDEVKANKQLEIYDDLSGLKICKHLLGPSPNMKNIISENFSWMEVPDNFTHLFNLEKLDELTRNIKKEHGLKAWWEFRSQRKRLDKIINEFNKILKSKNLLHQLTASNHTRKIFNRQLAQIMDPLVLSKYLGGEINFKDFQKRLNREYEFTKAEVKSMRDTAKEVKDEIENNASDVIIKLLRVIAQYRLHLKYYRFAHRVFNRFSLLTDEEEIKLSSQAGTLYQLPIAAEVTDDENRIVHHSILKADVRGSTTVTDELEKKDLNPASYFSLRFFGPINKVLEAYGANKVFIEGDAVILSFLEFEKDPQHWHSVAHACGMAKSMLSVVSANNKYSKEMDLPPIELGIGLCYADYAPRFLYDGETPIMISSAIGDADRMSSCSWKLRAVIKDHPFNVEVMEIASDDHSKGEKGQEQIRYNVNGILLDNVGFEKLQNEIVLTRITGQIAGKNEVFYYGEYPDKTERKRTLVIREGQVSLWKNESIQPHDIDEKFYEVVTNPQISAVIQKKMHSTQPEKDDTPKAEASDI